MSRSRRNAYLLPAIVFAGLGTVLVIPFVTSSDSRAPSPAPRAEWSDYSVDVKSGPFEVDLMLNARLQAGRSVTLSSALPSNMAKILELAPDGAYLKKGDLVARFDRRPLEDALRKVRREIRDTEAQLSQMNADLALLANEGSDKAAQMAYAVEVARKERKQLVEVELPAKEARAARDFRKASAALEQAKTDHATQSQLVNKGLGTTQDLNRAAAEFRELEADYRIAAEALAGLRDVTIPAEHDHARMQLENRERESATHGVTLTKRLEKQKGAIHRTENKLQVLREEQAEAESHLALAELRAPVTGILLHRRVSAGLEKRKPQVGDSLWKGHAFAVIPDMSSMIAQAAVTEREVGTLAVGQPVVLTPDAYPELRLEGHLASIGTLVETDRGEPRFDVRIQLSMSDERLRPGMSGRAAVRTASLEEALRVPVQAVFVEDMSNIGFIMRGDDVEQVALKLGPSDGREVVVKSGLAAGEKVLMIYPESLR